MNDIEVGDTVEWRMGGYKHGTRFAGVVTMLYPSIAVVKVWPEQWRYPDRKKLRLLRKAEAAASGK